MLRISHNTIPDPEHLHRRFESLKTINTGKNAKILAQWLVRIGIMLILCLFLPWQQNIPGSGKLTALDPASRPQTIQTAIAGRISSWKIKEGQYVNKGDTILTLTEIKDDYFDPDINKRIHEQLEAKVTSIAAAKDQIEAILRQIEALKSGLQYSLQKARNKVRQNKLKVVSDSADFEAERVQFDIATKQLSRYKQLFENDGLISLTDLERRNLKVQETMAKRMSTQNKFFVAKNELLNSIIELNSLGAEYLDKISKSESELGSKKSYLADAESEFSKLKNKLANVEVRQAQYSLLAPQAGYIVKALKFGIGETVKENEALVTIMPNVKTMAVELYVKAMDVPLLGKGRHVRIQFDGWPVLQFSGWPHASVGTFGGEVVVIDYVASEDGNYRILVVPDKSETEPWPEQLRLGSRAHGWVMLNDVPVWYEMWRQINGFPPTITMEEAAKNMDNGVKK